MFDPRSDQSRSGWSFTNSHNMNDDLVDAFNQLAMDDTKTDVDDNCCVICLDETKKTIKIGCCGQLYCDHCFLLVFGVHEFKRCSMCRGSITLRKKRLAKSGQIKTSDKTQVFRANPRQRMVFNFSNETVLVFAAKTHNWVILPPRGVAKIPK
jgi:hypothetical protein